MQAKKQQSNIKEVNQVIFEYEKIEDPKPATPVTPVVDPKDEKQRLLLMVHFQARLNWTTTRKNWLPSSTME